MTSSLRSRRLLVAVGMVGAPICLAVGNLLAVDTGTTAATEAAALNAHSGQFLAAAVVQAAGFTLLGVVGVGIAMLVQRRGNLLATIAALITLIGGIVMGGAVLTSAFVQVAIATSGDTHAMSVLQNDAGVGGLFEFAIVSALGGLLAAIALLIGRPVPVWVTIVFILGVLLSSFGGGVLGAALSIPFLVGTALLARALVRGDGVAAASERVQHGVAVSA